MTLARLLTSTLALGVLSQHAWASAPGQVPLAPINDASTSGPAPARAGQLDVSSLVDALDAMQDTYFSPWLGTWPDAIDWTAAVLGTHMPASLKTISRVEGIPEELEPSREELVNAYFSDVIAFYWGQAWLELLFQAYDDILWVVLGWLEALTFVRGHAALRHGNESRAWYGEKFVGPFAHRARIFWEAAEAGWDETLCGGGMVWNPRLAPYKNAITNELFIAASAAMYIHFPGDDIGAPLLGSEEEGTEQEEDEKPEYKAHDKKYLRAAVKAYDWLYSSNMTNEKGLFVDGFHIKGWRGGHNPSLGTRKCDVRDETVYTYNQGVVLTGQRNLWQATGNMSYLRDGHRLIRNVINATGWSDSAAERKKKDSWQGLGRVGVLEDRCDSNGDCSQDAQMFKGIFFLHFNAFCQPLPVAGDDDFGHKAPPTLADLHAAQCAGYAPWVAHNAQAAAQTRDDKGLFSMWWAEKLSKASPDAADHGTIQGADVRNRGVPDDEIWRIDPGSDDSDAEKDAPRRDSKQGRGKRTVEIQSGGVSVLRALIDQSIRARSGSAQ